VSILTANEQDFLDAVNDDVRDTAAHDVHDDLRSPEGLDRWIVALSKMKRDAESQLANDKAERTEKRLVTNKDEWMEFVAKRDRWRANVIRFKSGVENKLAEATYLRSERTSPWTAIAEHREIVLRGTDEEAANADELLWELLGTRL
jgi:hypothetical protein